VQCISYVDVVNVCSDHMPLTVCYSSSVPTVTVHTSTAGSDTAARTDWLRYDWSKSLTTDD